MTMQTAPNLGTNYGWDLGEANWKTGFDNTMLLLDAVTQLSVKDKDLTTPPGSPAAGDRYLVAASPTGAWAGWANRIAVYIAGAWTSYVPKKGWTVYVEDEGFFYIYSGTAWAVERATMMSALVKRTTAQTLATSGTAAAASFDAAVREDVGTMWDVSQPTRLVVPAGYTKARVSAGVSWAANATGSRKVTLLKNGAAFDGAPSHQSNANAVSGETTDQSIVSGIVAVAANDYFEVQLRHTAGASLDTVAQLLWAGLEVFA